jgi:DNA-binding response OmpR family regulator
MARILIIDDEEYIRSAVRSTLSDGGHEIREANDGESGLRMFRESRPDLVITDIMMPGKGGLEVIPEMREADSEVKIIAMSALGYDALPKAIELGANHTFELPFDPRALVEAVERLLGE